MDLFEEGRMSAGCDLPEKRRQGHARFPHLSHPLRELLHDGRQPAQRGELALKRDKDNGSCRHNVASYESLSSFLSFNP